MQVDGLNVYGLWLWLALLVSGFSPCLEDCLPVPLRPALYPFTDLFLPEFEMKSIFSSVYGEGGVGLLWLVLVLDGCGMGEVPALYFGEESNGVEVEVLFNPIAH